ncbi:unknown similar to AMEV160 [Adoxophyes honmai entomopoxvirus 'L']|uniref:Uncharacterized protein n=1 Tax=Adoxophyes honmai entomopoxvirus 'L' TaxID=1293540 RepID=A0A916KPM7_9POXV|nr:unknown similar to AMEV160 [Adoxophyes honmai entomopoxvirus 'L']CCU55495.1 unknown similar to AMEV160 [Adoxophyes honmai entomopoxvirus 'L']
MLKSAVYTHLAILILTKFSITQSYTDIELCLVLNNIEYKHDITLLNSDTNILIKHYNNLIIECNQKLKLIKTINLSKYKNIINNKIIYYKHNCYDNNSCIYTYSIEKKILYYIILNHKNYIVKKYYYDNVNINLNCRHNIIIEESLFKCGNYTFGVDIFIKHINNQNYKKLLYIISIIIIFIIIIILIIIIYFIYKNNLFVSNKIYNIYETIRLPD